MENTSNVSSQALGMLQSDLRGLSQALHQLYDDMNADMSQVNDFWQDQQYQNFVNGYRPQINKCEEISQRYNRWCSTVLQEATDKVAKIEMTDVTSSLGGGASSAGAMAGTAEGGSVSSASGPRISNIDEEFNMGSADISAAGDGGGRRLGGKICTSEVIDCSNL